MHCYDQIELSRKIAKFTMKYNIYFHSVIQATFTDRLINPQSGIVKYIEQELIIDMSIRVSQPLVKMSTRKIPGGKGGRCVRLTTSPPSRAECHEIWEPKPPGTFWATPGLLRDCFTSMRV